MNMYTQLANGMQFTLHKISRLKYYFIAEICEKKQRVKHLVNMWFVIILTKFNWLYWRQVVVFLLLYLVLLLVHQAHVLA